jgi:alkanesulfonate monooxygenase SsuD/methylene tetrahydromethanopterin reductase-like flavin-dependent oxidoreductase (luciferase family)
MDPAVSVRLLSHVLGTDLTIYDLDAPYPAGVVAATTDRSRSMAGLVAGISETEGLPTIRAVAARFAAGLTHVIVAGTPYDVADTMEEWFRAGACDGFLVAPLASPVHLTRFVDEVVPELQRRGLFRTEYEHETLRGNLGLAPDVAATGAGRASSTLGHI